MCSPFSVLYLQQNLENNEQILSVLDTAHQAFNVTCVKTRKEFLSLLNENTSEIILADYPHPCFSGISALELAQEICPDVPFLFITAGPGEALALNRTKIGTADIVDKSQISSLFQVIHRAEQNREAMTQQRTSETLLREELNKARHYLDVTGMMVMALDARGNLFAMNPKACETFECQENAIIGKNFFHTFLPSSAFKDVMNAFQDFLSRGTSALRNYETPIVFPDGREKIIYWYNTLVKDEAGKAIGTISSGNDITQVRHTEASLKATQLNYKQLYDQMIEGVYQTSPTGKIISANPALVEMLGYESEHDLCSIENVKLLYPKPELHTVWSQILKDTGEVRNADLLLQKKDGTHINVLENARAIRDNQGQITHYVGTVRDVTEFKNIEQQLQLQSSALSAAANAIVITDRTGRIIWVNPAFSKLTGYTSTEALGQNPKVLRSGEHDPAFYKKLWDTIASGRTWQGEIVNRRKNGSLYTEEMTITPVRAQDGTVTHFVAIKTDISKRKLTEKALKESEARYRAVTQAAVEAMISVDSSGKIITWNNGARKIFGYQEAEIKGKPITDLLPESYRGAFQKGLDHFFSANQNNVLGKTIEAHGLNKDGAVFPVEISTATWKIGAEQFYSGIIRDITERKKNAKEIKDNYQQQNLLNKLHQISQYSNTLNDFLKQSLEVILFTPFLEIMPRGAIFLAENATETLALKASHGFEDCPLTTEKEFLMMQFFKDRATTNDRIEIVDTIDWLYETGDPDMAPQKYYYIPLLFKEKILGLLLLYPDQDNQGSERELQILRTISNTLAGIIQNMLSENELLSAYQETEHLLSSISSVLIGVDGDDNVYRWNTAAEQLFNIPAQAVIGKPFMTCPIQWNWKEILEYITYSLEKTASKQWENIPYKRSNGKEGFLSISVNPIKKNIIGNSGFLLLATEVTEHKILEMQLVNAQKLESIGQLAAGIAHEINTPIQYVGDNTRFLEDAFQDVKDLVTKYEQLRVASGAGMVNAKQVHSIESFRDEIDMDYLLEEIPNALQQSLEGVVRVSDIVRAMKAFSHPGSVEKSPTDINKAIENTIVVARNEWKYVAEVETVFDDALPMVSCFPGEFNQVILNMIVNAAHAIADVLGENADKKGQITISTLTKDNGIEIRIKDTGSGIPREVQEKIFDPFFTTKEVGKGTGQGLAISYNVIVNKHGGSITFETEMDKGTTFIIKLPIYSDGLSLKT